MSVELLPHHLVFNSMYDSTCEFNISLEIFKEAHGINLIKDIFFKDKTGFLIE